jgi:trigger factor
LANWSLVERAAKIGDRITVNYNSLLHGKPYENSRGEDVVVELGSHGFIEGFEEGLLSAKAGETRALDLFFPDDWRFEKLAGKPVHFSVQIKSVEEKQLAILDEQFAKKMGASEGTESAIRQKVQENLEKQLETMLKENIKKQVLEQLLVLNEMELPSALIEHEITLLHEDLHRKMGNKKEKDCQHHGLEEEAKKRVRLSLILRKIIHQENLTANDKNVREKIAEIAKGFGNAELIENMYYESKELLANVQNSVLVEEVIDLILTKASIILKSVTMEEFFKQT